MSVLDNALQTLFKLGIEVKTLWENASPGSSFPEQNITVNTSGCDFVLIPLKGSANAAGILVGGNLLLSNIGEAAQHVAQNSAKMVSRGATWTSTGRIAISSCQTVNAYANAGTRTDSPTYMVPLAVYGIKLLGGVVHKVKAFATSLFARKEVLV